MLSIWIIHRDPKARAAVARISGVGERAVLASPTDRVLERADAPTVVVLGLSDDFEVELDFVHRHAARLAGCDWILLAESADLDEARRLFDTLPARVLPYPPEPRALRRALRASVQQRHADPLSARQGRAELQARFARWFGDLELPELIRALDPRLTRVPVLIHGEEGTGRGLLARYVHVSSGHAEDALIQITCREDTRAEDLLRPIGLAEGTERSGALAFYFEDVDRLPVALQHRLRDWIEFGLPEGATRRHGHRFMASAASVHDLDGVPGLDPRLAETLSGLTISLPPLRERAAHVAPFVVDTAGAIARRRSEPARRFSAEALARLSEHPWPGNLHELEAMVTRTLSFTSANPVEPIHLRFPTDVPWLDGPVGRTDLEPETSRPHATIVEVGELDEPEEIDRPTAFPNPLAETTSPADHISVGAGLDEIASPVLDEIASPVPDAVHEIAPPVHDTVEDLASPVHDTVEDLASSEHDGVHDLASALHEHTQDFDAPAPERIRDRAPALPGSRFLRDPIDDLADLDPGAAPGHEDDLEVGRVATLGGAPVPPEALTNDELDPIDTSHTLEGLDSLRATGTLSATGTLREIGELDEHGEVEVPLFGDDAEEGLFPDDDLEEGDEDWIPEAELAGDDVDTDELFAEVELVEEPASPVPAPESLGLEPSTAVEPTELLPDIEPLAPPVRPLPEAGEADPVASTLAEDTLPFDEPFEPRTPAPAAAHSGAIDERLYELVGAIAHEVRNPLVSIRTFSELLPDHYDDPEFRNHFRELVVKDVQRIDRVVSRLQSLAEGQRKPEPVDMARLLDRLLDERRPVIQARRLLVLKELDHTQPTVLADAEQVEDAIAGLIDRAIEQASERGDVYLASKYDDGGPSGRPLVRVLIRHTRASADVSSSTRVEIPTSDQAMLDLVLAKRLIEAQGGELAVDEAEAGESVIVVDLPAA